MSKQNIRNLWIKTLLSVLFTLSLFLIPMNFPLIHDKLNILLTLPVLAAGYKIFVMGGKALFERKPTADTLTAAAVGAAFIYCLYHAILGSSGTTLAQEYPMNNSAAVIMSLALLGKSFEAMIILKAGGKHTNKTEEVEAGFGGVESKAEDNSAFLVSDNGSAFESDEVSGFFVRTTIIAASAAGVLWYMTGGFRISAALSAFISVLVIVCPRAFVSAKQLALSEGIKKALGYGVMITGSEMVHTLSKTNVVVFNKLRGLTEGKPQISDILSIEGASRKGRRGRDSNHTHDFPVAGNLMDGANGNVGVRASFGAVGVKSARNVKFDDPIWVSDDEDEHRDIDGNYILAVAAAAEQNTDHPIGKTIIKAARDRRIEIPTQKSTSVIQGFGVESVIGGEQVVLVGSCELMAERGVCLDLFADEVNNLSDEGKTPVCVAVDGALLGVVALYDELRSTCAAMVSELKGLGIEAAMITGDNRRTADAIAKKSGISRVIADVKPFDAANEIEKLKGNGRVLAMTVGTDCDARELLAADIRIIISSREQEPAEDLTSRSTDGTAGIVICESDISGIPKAIVISRKTVRSIKQNVFWALGYNLIGVIIAAIGFVDPIISAIAMFIAGILPLLNALRLKRV